MLDSVLLDARQVLRAWRRSPGFAAAAIVTIALAIGANVGVFSLIQQTFLAPLPYPDADRLVQLWLVTNNGQSRGHSVPGFNLLSRQ
jgi:putative ABC transport system permease protein